MQVCCLPETQGLPKTWRDQMNLARSQSAQHWVPKGIGAYLLAICLFVTLPGPAGARPPEEVDLPALARLVPPTIQILRLETTPYQAVLVGKTPDWENVAELIEKLAQLPGFGESELIELVAAGKDYRFLLAVPYAKKLPMGPTLAGFEGQEWRWWDKILPWLYPESAKAPKDPIEHPRDALAPPETEDALDASAHPPDRPPAAQTPQESALLELECGNLRAPEALLREVLTQAEKRIQVYEDELRLAESRFSRVDRGTYAQFQKAAAQAAADELAFLFHSQLPGLKRLNTQSPPPGEIFSLFGDLELIAGRHRRAAAAYQLAERRSPEYRPLCGRLFAGRLYGVESLLWPTEARRRVPVGYLLAWDPLSGRVVERRALTSLPNSFSAERDSLRITFARSPELQVPFLGPGLPTPQRHEDLVLGFQTIRSSVSPVLNFIQPESLNRFEVGHQFESFLPWSLPELEVELHARASQDPTQPWHRLWLGQLYSTRGRSTQAEKIWQEIFPELEHLLPSRDLVWMAAYHEFFGRPAWGDRIYAVAAAQPQSQPPPRLRHGLRRQLHGYPAFFDLWLRRHPERHFVWWQRLHELKGNDQGDSLRSVFWSEERARRGDPVGAQAEIARAQALRRGDPTLEGAWLDYALYLVLAISACIYARWTLLTLEMPFGIRPRFPPEKAKVGARAWLQGAGPELALLHLALFLALILTLLAAAYLGLAEFSWYSDGASAEPGFGHFVQALLAGGIFENTPPTRLIASIHDFDALRWLVVLLGAPSLGFLATPAAMVLSLKKTRDFAARWVPGARYFRQGSNWRGLLIFGLFVFAFFPLLRLGLVATGYGLPTPGLATEVYLRRFEPLYLPPGRVPYSSPNLSGSTFFPEDSFDWTDPEGLERLSRRSFWSLQTIYPGSKVFWLLVLASLALSLWAHLGSPRIMPSPKSASP